MTFIETWGSNREKNRHFSNFMLFCFMSYYYQSLTVCNLQHKIDHRFV